MRDDEPARTLVEALNPIRWGGFERRLLVAILVLTGLNILVGLVVLVTL